MVKQNVGFLGGNSSRPTTASASTTSSRSGISRQQDGHESRCQRASSNITTPAVSRDEWKETLARHHRKEAVIRHDPAWMGSLVVLLLAEQRRGWAADVLLCSRNARSRVTLVGCAQWEINQPPSLKRERSKLGGIIGNFVRRAHERIDQAALEKKIGVWEDSHSKGQPRPLLQREM